MLDILTSFLGGGITGLIGTIINSYMKYKILKLQLEHEKQMKELQLKQMEVEANIKKQLIQIQTEAQIDITNAEIYKQRYQYLNKNLFDSTYYDKLPKSIQSLLGLSFGFVDILRALIRPTLTITLTLLTVYILYINVNSLPNDVSQKILILSDKFDAVVNTILFLTTTIISWWFGNRDIEKFLQNQYSNKKF